MKKNLTPPSDPPGSTPEGEHGTSHRQRQQQRRQFDVKLLHAHSLLTTWQVAEHIGYAPATVHNLVAKGRFPPADKRNHSRNLWFWSTVHAWLVANHKIDEDDIGPLEDPAP